jgi:type IX secretion system PorP/SprF family membrane protein
VKIKFVIGILVSAFMLMNAANSYGQDFHYSQFMYSPGNLGAGNVGTMSGDLRIAANHRRQWASVTVPYQTFSIGADQKLESFSPKLKNWSAGILINHDKAGDGALSILNASLSAAYQFSLDKDSIYHLNTGISFGFAQKSIDFNKLTFDNQFDGDIFVPGSATGENPDNAKLSNADLGAGLSLQRNGAKSNMIVGMQLRHLNRPDQNMYNGEAVPQSILSQFFAQVNYPLNNSLILQPAIQYSSQLKFAELVFGSEVKLILKNETTSRYAVSGGLFLRNKDAIIPTVALDYNKFRIGFSYDVNISSLKAASNGKGGPEISLIYQAMKIKSKTQHKIICPIY